MQLHPIYCTPRSIERNSALKRQCHEIFCFWFFSWINLPPAPEYSIKTISNFFENSRRYSQFKVHHRYQRHRREICPLVSLALLIPVATGVNDTGGKFPTSVKNASGKLPQVSTTPAENLPPVLFTPVANNGSKYQTADNLKWTWREKNLSMYANSTTQRCPKEIIKILLIEDVFYLHTGGKLWAANISANFRKNSKRSFWYNQGLGGNWFMKKTRSKKSHDTVPLN